ncbi:hypothetical protein [Achromobacter piechaudii]|uniref:hypothetical protein n=1 Tax=Achromobacter piechaudii TaxID=72556 RepID=UPI0014670FEF|nr:hypothetical protein [Achromobacter piechaudii]CAB3952816.1 hypothetical protein LMG6103_03571 [Achromobacter piechaudii]
MNQIGQYVPPPPPSIMSSSLGSAQMSDGEILDSIANLGKAIADCEFIAQQLVGRLDPVLVSAMNQTCAGGIAQTPQPETRVAQLVQDNTHRVRALTLSIESAAQRLALP